MRHSLAITIGLFSLLASCSSMEGLRLSGSATGGSMTDFDLDGLDLDGGDAIGASVKLTRPSPDFPELEPGFRVDFTYKEVDDSDGGVDVDLESFELSVAPMVRWNPSLGEGWQPFFDVFLGYTHNWYDADLAVGNLAVSPDPDGGGLWFGVGAGVEFEMTESLDVHFGAEFIWLDYDIGDFDDIDESRLQGFFGVTHTF